MAADHRAANPHGRCARATGRAAMRLATGRGASEEAGVMAVGRGEGAWGARARREARTLARKRV